MSNSPAPTLSQDIDICQYALRQNGYDFRLNKVTGRIEVFGKRIQPLDDNLFKVIHAEIRHHFKIKAELLDISIAEMANANQFHPIKDYLNSLKYDGGQHFQALLSCFDNPDGLLPLWLRKWMIGAISKTITSSQNPMLVLDGPQNTGKSLFVKWLCSGIPDYFIESGINTDDKDAFDRLASRWIWEVSEIGATIRKSDMEALKHFITMSEITIRPAYGRFSITRKALASMIGTVNHTGDGIFNDPTGSRRFMICEVKKIDWEEYTKIDINQLWAEIYVAYLSGESYELTPDEKKIQTEKNKQYQPTDILEDYIRDGFDIDLTKTNDPAYFTPTTVIADYLQNTRNFKSGTTSTLNRMIAQSCKCIGLEIGTQIPFGIPGTLPRRARGYKGIKKT
jgi:predicted P-loop ATPase